MKYSTWVIVEYKGHQELIQFLVMETSNSDVVLGYNWLQHHNLSIDWLNGMVKLNRCLALPVSWTGKHELNSPLKVETDTATLDFSGTETRRLPSWVAKR